MAGKAQIAREPSAGWFEGRAHYLPVRVYYEDTDFTGLVYHANYARYFERGRSDFLRLTGLDHADLLSGEKPTAFVVSKMTIDFLKPARIDDALTVRTTYDTMRGPRLTIGQSLRRGAEILAEAEVLVACIGLNGRPRRPPTGLAERLLPYLWPSGEPPP